MQKKYLGPNYAADFNAAVAAYTGTATITLDHNPVHTGTDSAGPMQYFTGKGGITTPDPRAT